MKCVPLLLALALALPASAQTEVTIAPSQDATLYQTDAGTLANGGGSHLFVGRTQGGNVRRGLVAFDVAASVPAGATIESAELVLTMNRSVVGATPIAAHRVARSWTEGTDDASGQEGRGATASTGAATWIHTAFDTDRWSAPGGDFSPTASASATVDGTGPYVWRSTAALVADVQGWLDTPTSNHGWILIGDETAASAKRFDSTRLSNAPALRVTYAGGGTSAEDGADGAGVALLGARPNPFEATTTIAFALDAAAEVRLDIADVLGRQVAVLVDGPRAAGTHRVALDAGDLPEGLYLARLRAGNVQRTTPIVRGR